MTNWILLFLMMGCAQVTSLNLKKHQFGLVPTKIIWFQVAGLEEEQIAMLRFGETADKRTSFEANTCIGQTWNYNLYNLRNSAASTFLTQITGKKNVKGTCEDASLRPMWNYIYPNGYSTAILESVPSENDHLLAMSKCKQAPEQYLNTVYYFLRAKPPKDALTFHYSREVKMQPGQVAYDVTCGEGGCSSRIFEDFSSIYNSFRKVSSKQLFILRDFTYLKALIKNDFSKAKEILMDIERTYAEALKLTNSNDFLVLLTTGDSRFVDMPDQGKSFFEFDKTFKNASAKRTKLTNLVLATGARAENFCGIYDDSEVFERILSGARQQGLELKIINPFK